MNYIINVILYESIDFGASWALKHFVSASASSISAGQRLGLYQAPDGRLYAGWGTLAAGRIYRSAVSVLTTLGKVATCSDEVFITNHSQIANLTNIFISDGGVFSSIFPSGAFPVNILPAIPAVNDATYFGISGDVANGGGFDGLAFDIGTRAGGEIELIWEYWNGAAWVTLTIIDNTEGFSVQGVNSVTWQRPSAWATTTVNSVVNTYWVRVRVTSVSGSPASPTQQNIDIYAITRPYIDIDQAQVLGDIPAIAEIKLSNVSDYDGPGGSAPNLYSNRVVTGLRSTSRGNAFNAFINLSLVQVGDGITLSLGTNTTFVLDVTAPAVWRATYNPGGVEAMATRATIAIGGGIAPDFYGTFHAFLRAKRTAGVSTDLTVRLQVATGSGGITFTTVSQQLQTTTAFEVLDFGEITLPVSSSFKSTDLADTTEIRIQASAASGTPDLYLYDLILIPVDEWSADVVDFANESDSDVGRSNGIAKLLDIDSVTDPRIDIKGLVRTADASEFITSEYNVICGGPAILQSNADQRLWFFAMQTSATGLSYSWISPPEIAHTVQVFKNQRYLGMRGAR